MPLTRTRLIPWSEPARGKVEYFWLECQVEENVSYTEKKFFVRIVERGRWDLRLKPRDKETRLEIGKLKKNRFLYN